MKEIASSIALVAASPDPRASRSSSLRLSSQLPLGSGSSREGGVGSGLRKGVETSSRRGSPDSLSSSPSSSMLFLQPRRSQAAILSRPPATRVLHEEAWYRFVIVSLISVGIYALYGQYHANPGHNGSNPM